MKDKRIHVFDKQRSKNWSMWFYDENNKQVTKTTRYPKIEFTRVQIERIFNEPTKEVVNYTLGWFRDYTADRLKTEGLTHSTKELYKNSLEHLITYFGIDHDIHLIKRGDAILFQGSLIKSGMKPVSANTYMRHIRAAFERLVTGEILQTNPFAKIKPFIERKAERQSLTLDELKKLLECIDSSPDAHYKHLARILIFTGIRRNEVLILKREDVDLLNKLFRPQNSKHADKRKRWVTIPDGLIPDFEYFLLRFGNSPFNVCHPDTLTHWVKERFNDIKLPYFHLHSLRHTFITLAIEHGADIWFLKDYIGHSSVNVTALYTHNTIKRMTPGLGF